MILDEIVAAKREEVAERKRLVPRDVLESQAASAPAARDFKSALRVPGNVGLIAEVKKASPSRGVMAADLDPVATARTYERCGAAAISVLTDKKFFCGSLDFLRDVRTAVAVPVLCKEFVIDERQVYEARAAGADAVLLIVRILTDDELSSFMEEARKLGMASLVEIHSKEELVRAISASAEIIGINNRNLETFETRLGTTIELASEVPDDVVFVSESGIKTREDVDALAAVGVDAVLVGESLVTSGAIETKIDELLGRTG